MNRFGSLLSTVFMVAAVGAPLGCASAGPAGAGPAVTDASPDAGAAALDRVLAAEPRTLVVFTTAWCQVCAKESPALVAWARAHRDRAKVVVVVSGSAPAEAARVARERRLEPDAVDVVVDASGAVADRYGVQATPTLVAFEGATRGGSWQSIADVPVP